ncbi:hypothetical protein, partial [Okeania hirsuta]|uniref:hypothetical protein n=1 Tax=Okeania hirsuta TaxID=1458930 RepID=UPI0019602BCB
MILCVISNPVEHLLYSWGSRGVGEIEGFKYSYKHILQPTPRPSPSQEGKDRVRRKYWRKRTNIRIGGI